MKALSSKELIKMLKDNGWILKNVNGDHHHYIHPIKKGKITVPHPNKDLPRALVKAILRQAGLY